MGKGTEADNWSFCGDVHITRVVICIAEAKSCQVVVVRNGTRICLDSEIFARDSAVHGAALQWSPGLTRSIKCLEQSNRRG